MVKASTSEWLLLLNPDIRLDKEALLPLLATAACWDNAAIIGPQLVLANGTLQRSYDQPFWCRARGNYLAPNGPACTAFVPFAAVLLRRSAYLSVGGFDPAIFLYFEDDDLCLRLKRAGYCVLIEPAAVIHHALGKSTTPSAASDGLRAEHRLLSEMHLRQKFGLSQPSSSLARWRAALALIKWGINKLVFRKNGAARAAGRYRAWRQIITAKVKQA